MPSASGALAAARSMLGGLLPAPPLPSPSSWTSLTIVPAASADPGFGDVAVAAAADHVTVCKPQSRQSEDYARLRAFAERVVVARPCPAAGRAAGPP
jgi:hypothetical protein